MSPDASDDDAGVLPNDWGPTLAELHDRRAAARAMGGDDRLAQQHAAGKLDARRRVALLCDAGSFVEIGTLVGDVPADGIVAGTGLIDGRPVMVAPRISRRWPARSGEAATPSATASPSSPCASGCR